LAGLINNSNKRWNDEPMRRHPVRRSLEFSLAAGAPALPPPPTRFKPNPGPFQAFFPLDVAIFICLSLGRGVKITL
jgi:hypothetical protein